MPEGPGEDEREDSSDQTWGSDFIADLLTALDVEYIAFNPEGVVPRARRGDRQL